MHLINSKLNCPTDNIVFEESISSKSNMVVEDIMKLMVHVLMSNKSHLSSDNIDSMILMMWAAYIMQLTSGEDVYHIDEQWKIRPSVSQLEWLYITNNNVSIYTVFIIEHR